jgi:peptidoglycan/LPS O-acetylase OafA/YrhL
VKTDHNYRPDIDGLRAIAVLAVVLYHAFPNALPGGFVGVDIFFVISGYLITKLILQELQSGSFKISNFYLRRAKRIFPALIVVLIAVIGLGWLILTPEEYKRLGVPIAGGAGFLANFVFWKESGYFDISADSKPLLHLWSLGIEEQFYVVWPLFLVWISRRRRSHSIKFFFGVLLASFVYSVFLVFRDTTAAFYSPIARFWELWIGAALAYVNFVWGAQRLADGLQSPLALLGLTLCFLSLILIDSNSSFPGAWALMPTIGTALIILAGSREAPMLNTKILAARPLVAIGLISYPLYLWHWPLLSFARIMESETPSPEIRIGLVGLSVALAWLTYRFIEIPIRRQTFGRAKKIVLGMSVVLLAVFIAGITIRKMDGLKFRALTKLNGDVSTLTIGKDRANLIQDCGISDDQRKMFQWCVRSNDLPPKFAVLGDSKAEAIFYGLAREAGSAMGGLLIGSVSPPHIDVPKTERQRKNRIAFDNLLTQNSVEVVILANALRTLFAIDKMTGFVNPEIVEINSPEWLQRYSDTIRKLENSGKRVVFLIDNPTFPDPRSCIAGGMTESDFLNQILQRKPNPRCAIDYSDHIEGTSAYRAFVDRLSRAHPKMIIYDPTPLLCDLTQNLCKITYDNKFLYSYSDHYSDYGNSRVGRDLLRMLVERGLIQ